MGSRKMHIRGFARTGFTYDGNSPTAYDCPTPFPERLGVEQWWPRNARGSWRATKPQNATVINRPWPPSSAAQEHVVPRERAVTLFSSLRGLMPRSRNPPASVHLMREHSLVPRLVEADDKFPRQRASVCTLPRASWLGAATSVVFFANARALDTGGTCVRDASLHNDYIFERYLLRLRNPYLSCLFNFNAALK